ncbi:MAG TPA: hypothetical protein VKE22_25895 [Haliangiales bacterium]|nr:hypothetical protein [Haliangiales bacterium]
MRALVLLAVAACARTPSPLPRFDGAEVVQAERRLGAGGSYVGLCLPHPVDRPTFALADQLRAELAAEGWRHIAASTSPMLPELVFLTAARDGYELKATIEKRLMPGCAHADGRRFVALAVRRTAGS